MNRLNRDRNAAVIAAILTLGLAGCQAKSESAATADPPKSAPAASATTGDTVALDPAMLANLKLERMRETAVPRLLTATGKIQLNEDQTARVLSPMPGQVMDLRVRLGDRVAKDDVL